MLNFFEDAGDLVVDDDALCEFVPNEFEILQAAVRLVSAHFLDFKIMSR